MMKLVAGITCFCFCLVVMTSLRSHDRPVVGVEPALAFFRSQAEIFASSTAKLQAAIIALDKKKPSTLVQAKEALKRCRLDYKKIEFFLAYFFNTAAWIYNGPPKPEVEEPFMEYEEPIGLQVIEGLLFEANPQMKKQELLQQVEAINSSAQDLPSLLYGFQANDQQLLESVRLELIRMITLGITGFDAPSLKSGVAVAVASLVAMQVVLQPFLSMPGRYADSVSYYLHSGLSFLHNSGSFDGFDRLSFLKFHALPLQRQLALLITELQLDLNTSGGALNYAAGDIFNAEALNIDAFAKNRQKASAALISLGKKLFFERRLSANAKRSCASCHQPEKYFSDGLAKGLALDGHSLLKRNAPSLLYSGFQFEQFWEGRAKSMEEQVKAVITDPAEMGGGLALIQSMIKDQPAYTELFEAAFPDKNDSLTIMDKTAEALAAYVGSLSPRNSRFDRHLQSDTNILTAPEINGFNLFMGKAQCGTCHFAPLFNGLVPPLFSLSEVEVVGTTRTDDLQKPAMDNDRGRYTVFPIGLYDNAFKTPTVRNVSATAPYMHNGSFRTLESVVEFYNKGGGAGLGLQISNQTLSPVPLKLSKQEVKDIVSFLHALKDSLDINMKTPDEPVRTTGSGISEKSNF